MQPFFNTIILKTVYELFRHPIYSSFICILCINDVLLRYEIYINVNLLVSKMFVTLQTPSWLYEMIEFPTWRNLFYKISEEYPDSVSC